MLLDYAGLLRRALQPALGVMKATAALFRAFGIAIFASAFASLVLTFPEQTREYYRVLLENTHTSTRGFVIESAVGVFGVLLMAACITFAARVLEVDRQATGMKGSPRFELIAAWLPIALGAAPLLALSYGLWEAADIGRDLVRKEITDELRSAGFVEFAFSIDSVFGWVEQYAPYLHRSSLTILVLALVYVAGASFLARYTPVGVRFHAFTSHPNAALVSLFLAAIPVAVFALSPVTLPQAIGVVGIFALFVGVLAILSAQMSIWSRLAGIPIIGILVGCAILFSVLDWNDNHELRRIDQKGEAVAVRAGPLPSADALPRVKESFLDWYRQRPSWRAADDGRPYPVYIVAAQGGGIYAAAQSLLFLVKMQAACNTFNQHLFAISAVSGGAVGAAFYSALAEEFPATAVPCPPLAEYKPQAMRGAYLVSMDLMASDYLSPLAASALFPDFVQRFLPRSFQEWSRGRALEKALEAGWEKATAAGASKDKQNGNPLKGGMISSWRADGSRPALLLNTTEAGSGRRRVIAPFRFADTPANDLRFLPIASDYDVPLSAAAIASARFPWLTPAAWFREIGAKVSEQKIRLVDGGYFENSGVSTAIDLISELEDVALKHNLPVEFHLIVMTSGGFPSQSFSGLGEFYAPIQSLLNARQARTYATIDAADRQLGPIAAGKEAPGKPRPDVRRLQKVALRSFVLPLPLGWRLSRASVFQIDRLTGLMGHCVPSDRYEQTSPLRAFTSGDCVKELIYHQLRGDDIGNALQAARDKRKS